MMTHITENTRASYPLNFISNTFWKLANVESSEEYHFSNLRCFGSSAANCEVDIHAQAQYHFISGYTSKIAGTEIGLGIEPQITFSACFGAPFMVRHP